MSPALFRSMFSLDHPARFAQFAGTAALQSHEMLTEMIDKIDVLFALSSGLFLVGAGMTICFKKFVRYFIR